MSETFLVHDTACNGRAGKGMIDVFGGVKRGWQAEPAES